MHFLLMLVGDEAAEGALRDEERTAIVEAHGEYASRLRSAGAFDFGTALASSATASTVEVAGDGSITDGPYAETTEQIGGLYVIEVADLDEALAWARQVPVSPGLRVEVRPAVDV